MSESSGDWRKELVPFGLFDPLCPVKSPQRPEQVICCSGEAMAVFAQFARCELSRVTNGSFTSRLMLRKTLANAVNWVMKPFFTGFWVVAQLAIK